MTSPLNLICTRTPAGLVVMRCLGYFFQPGPLFALMELSCFASVFQIPVRDSQFPDRDSSLPPQTRKMALPEKFLRTAVVLACGIALAGCVSAPDDLLASTAIVAELPRESGPLVEAARFSAGRPGEAPPGGWSPFVVSPFASRTEYRLVAGNPHAVLEARADGSASGFYRRVHIDPRRHPVVEWRWRVLEPLAGVDPRVPSRDDSPARLVICFHGDAKRLDIGERNTLRLYKALTGEMLPYAMLMYVWASDAPVGSIASSVYTEKIQMIVVESGDSRAGEWNEFRRNVLEDYRQAFGEEPSDIVAVGVMTDADDTRAKTRAQYGDISFKPAQ